MLQSTWFPLLSTQILFEDELDEDDEDEEDEEDEEDDEEEEECEPEEDL